MLKLTVGGGLSHGRGEGRLSTSLLSEVYPASHGTGGRGGYTALDGASGAFLMAARQEPLSRPRCSVHPFIVKLKI